jgi:hypothetical protein
MENELHYLDEREMARFAAGVFGAAIAERMNAMTPCTAERLNIAQSMLFAALMLGAKWLWPHQLYALPMLLALWTIPLAYLSAKARRR